MKILNIDIHLAPTLEFQKEKDTSIIYRFNCSRKLQILQKNKKFKFINIYICIFLSKKFEIIFFYLLPGVVKPTAH